jgi:hypothetical protein
MSLSELRTDNKFSSILTKAQSVRLKYMGLEEGRTNPQEAEDVLVYHPYGPTSTSTQLK